MILALLLAAADPSVHPGFYFSNQIEVAAAIDLDANGSFEYALDYGAVSEKAEGKWTVNGDRILLTVAKSEGTEHGPPLGTSTLTFSGDELRLQRYDVTIRLTRDDELVPPPNRNHKLDEKD